MFRKIALVSSCCLLAACSTTTATLDSNSLSGWAIVGDADWMAKNGEITGSGEGEGFLASEAVFGDFHLKVEFRVDAETNSGIFIRCQDRQRIHPETCYEFNIWDRHPQQEARTGSIVFRAMPPLAHVDTLGRWNTYEITARGNTLEARVNGELTAVLEDSELSSGFLALQRWGKGNVVFRELVITSKDAKNAKTRR